MNNKGFLLIDSLICIFVVVSVGLLSISLYQMINKNEIIYEEYNKQSNEEYEILFNNLKECKCQIIEDSSIQEQ